MRLSRLKRDGAAEFCVDAGDGRWLALSSLGVVASDLPAAIVQFDRIKEAWANGSATGGGEDGPRLECPVTRPGKILGIGLNYRDFIRAAGMEAPRRPVVFAKFPNALTGPHDPIVVDRSLTEQADYEAELAVVVGRRCRRVGAEQALDAVFGYAVANDVSARDLQQSDPLLSLSKSLDGFCPIGPWITTADAVPDPQELGIRSFVNGEARQSSSTAEMVFGVASLIAYLSSTMTLEPGDVVLTGTPHGIGSAMDPPRFLQPGDVVRCEVDRLGAIENRVITGGGAT